MDALIDDVGLVVGLVLAVLAVGGVARALAWPAPLLLVGAGVAGSYLPVADDVQASPELVLVVLLPPLLYAAALQASTYDIREEVVAIASLSVGLVLATTLAVGFALHTAVPDIPLAAAMALGAVVAPPDAVAAAAVTRRAGLPRRSVAVLEGESLFNDATALVALRVSVAALAGGFGALDAVSEFAGAAAGGAAIGFAVGVVATAVRRRVTDEVTDTALSLTAPFLAYLPAEHVHASGILAVVVTGLVLAYRAPVDQEPRARLVETATWATLAHVLEGVVFVLIGLRLRDVAGSLDSSVGTLALAAAVTLAVVVVVRPLWIFTIGWLGRRLRPRREAAPWSHLAAESWAGMRGVVSLAAALALPVDVPERDLLVAVTVAVI
ncbi:MAG TPA: cation:proton antiporter, partial [Acidimicrobiales bacterium]|nr:cation:proton antiporter [Acidimicrobiales bacterium]